jgi:hypothetical protein
MLSLLSLMNTVHSLNVGAWGQVRRGAETRTTYSFTQHLLLITSIKNSY